MSQNLPTGGFKWIDVNNYKNDPNKKRMILEVDLEYPDHLHNDYPLAPEKIEIQENMLSGCCKQFKVKVGGIKKLIPILKSKKNYVLHYENLKLYTRLGLKITKIHRILAFIQSSWLKKYIDFNIDTSISQKSEKRQNQNTNKTF